MIGSVLSLIRTLVAIILLRKGPEALPRAPVVFVISAGLWLLASISALVLVENYTGNTFILGTVIGTVGFIIYALLINAAGKGERLLQALSAIIGCGAILSFTILICEALLPYVLGKEHVQAIITLIWLWSVPIEGHIVARAIDRLWYVGFVAASTVFVVQLFLLASLGPSIDPRPAPPPEQAVTGLS